MNIAIDYNNVLVKNEADWKAMARKFVKAGNEVYCIITDKNMSYKEILEAVKNVEFFLGKGHAVVSASKNFVDNEYRIDYWID